MTDELRLAILRCIQELNALSDGPAYCFPKSVQMARKALADGFNFSPKEMYSYAPDEDEENL